MNDPGEARTSRLPWGLKVDVKGVLALVFVVATSGLVFLFRDQLGDLERYESYGYLGAFVVSLLGSGSVFFPLPSLALVFALGGFLNPFLVGLAAGLGQTLGEITGYMAGYGGKFLVENSSAYDRVTNWMRRRGALTLFILSLIPNPFFDIAGVAAGCVRYPLWKFFLALFLGKTIKSIIFALAGMWEFVNLLEWFERVME